MTIEVVCVISLTPTKASREDKNAPSAESALEARKAAFSDIEKMCGRYGIKPYHGTY